MLGQGVPQRQELLLGLDRLLGGLHPGGVAGVRRGGARVRLAGEADMGSDQRGYELQSEPLDCGEWSLLRDRVANHQSVLGRLPESKYDLLL